MPLPFIMNTNTLPGAVQDPTLDFLRGLEDPNKYVSIPNVPIFVPHERKAKGKDGEDINIVITAEDLGPIAEQINQREVEYGVPPVLTVGHRQQSNPNFPEQMQPPIVGCVREAHVGAWGPQQKPAVLATLYYKKEDWEEAKKYPFRSVDFYPGSNKVTGVALLKRDPFLPMGIVSYANEGEHVTTPLGEKFVFRSIHDELPAPEPDLSPFEDIHRNAFGHDTATMDSLAKLDIARGKRSNVHPLSAPTVIKQAPKPTLQQRANMVPKQMFKGKAKPQQYDAPRPMAGSLAPKTMAGSLRPGSRRELMPKSQWDRPGPIIRPVGVPGAEGTLSPGGKMVMKSPPPSEETLQMKNAMGGTEGYERLFKPLPKPEPVGVPGSEGSLHPSGFAGKSKPATYAPTDGPIEKVKNPMPVRAPKGGIDIVGFKFTDGMQIPPSFASKMTPEQRMACGMMPQKDKAQSFNKVLSGEGKKSSPQTPAVKYATFDKVLRGDKKPGVQEYGIGSKVGGVAKRLFSKDTGRRLLDSRAVREGLGGAAGGALFGGIGSAMAGQDPEDILGNTAGGAILGGLTGGITGGAQDIYHLGHRVAGGIRAKMHPQAQGSGAAQAPPPRASAEGNPWVDAPTPGATEGNPWTGSSKGAPAQYGMRDALKAAALSGLGSAAGGGVNGAITGGVGGLIRGIASDDPDETALHRAWRGVGRGALAGAAAGGLTGAALRGISHREGVPLSDAEAHDIGGAAGLLSSGAGFVGGMTAGPREREEEKDRPKRYDQTLNDVLSSSAKRKPVPYGPLGSVIKGVSKLGSSALKNPAIQKGLVDAGGGAVSGGLVGALSEGSPEAILEGAGRGAAMEMITAPIGRKASTALGKKFLPGATPKSTGRTVPPPSANPRNTASFTQKGDKTPTIMPFEAPSPESAKSGEQIGSIAGGLIGGTAGGALGMLGGPLAPITAPLGATAGGMLGEHLGGKFGKSRGKGGTIGALVGAPFGGPGALVGSHIGKKIEEGGQPKAQTMPKPITSQAYSAKDVLRGMAKSNAVKRGLIGTGVGALAGGAAGGLHHAVAGDEDESMAKSIGRGALIGGIGGGATGAASGYVKDMKNLAGSLQKSSAQRVKDLAVDSRDQAVAAIKNKAKGVYKKVVSATTPPPGATGRFEKAAGDVRRQVDRGLIPPAPPRPGTAGDLQQRANMVPKMMFKGAAKPATYDLLDKPGADTDLNKTGDLSGGIHRVGRGIVGSTLGGIAGGIGGALVGAPELGSKIGSVAGGLGGALNVGKKTLGFASPKKAVKYDTNIGRGLAGGALGTLAGGPIGGAIGGVAGLAGVGKKTLGFAAKKGPTKYANPYVVSGLGGAMIGGGAGMITGDISSQVSGDDPGSSDYLKTVAKHALVGAGAGAGMGLAGEAGKQMGFREGYRRGSHATGAASANQAWLDAIKKAAADHMARQKQKADIKVTRKVYPELPAHVPMQDDRTSIEYAVSHAPTGGVTLAGKHFTGGQFIPAATLEKASPEELETLKKSKAADPKKSAKKTKSPAAEGGPDVLQKSVKLLDPELKKQVVDFISDAPPEARSELISHLNETLTGKVGDFISHATPEELHELHREVLLKTSDKGMDIRAPKGGISLNGHEFKEGHYIPPSYVERATPDEQDAVGYDPAKKGSSWKKKAVALAVTIGVALALKHASGLSFGGKSDMDMSKLGGDKGGEGESRSDKDGPPPSPPPSAGPAESSPGSPIDSAIVNGGMERDRPDVPISPAYDDLSVMSHRARKSGGRIPPGFRAEPKDPGPEALEVPKKLHLTKAFLKPQKGYELRKHEGFQSDEKPVTFSTWMDNGDISSPTLEQIQYAAETFLESGPRKKSVKHKVTLC